MPHQEYGPYAHRDAGADPRLPPLGIFFYEQAVKDEQATARNGAPVYDNAVMIRVVIPGAKNSWPIYEIERTRSDGSKKTDPHVMGRFGAVYEQFRQNRTPAQSGTPLEQWPLMDVALVAAFKDYNIATVQQLAQISDGLMDNIRIPKLREWRGKAHAWLEEARGAAVSAEAMAENARLKERVEQLEQMMNERLSAQNKTEGFDEAPKRARKRARTEGDDVPVVLPEDYAEVLQGDDRL